MLRWLIVAILLVVAMIILKICDLFINEGSRTSKTIKILIISLWGVSGLITLFYPSTQDPVSQQIGTLKRNTEQNLVVSPEVIDLGKGDWKAKCQFSIHNPTDVFFYGLWLKLSINSESLSCVDFEVIPPNNLPSTLFQVENGSVNLSLVRLDGIDPSGKESIYLILDTLAPGMTYTFELVNNSTNDLPSSVHSANFSILKYSSKPFSKMQGDVSGFMKIGSPPENFSMYRAFQLTEEGTLQLVEIRNEPGVIPNWSDRPKSPRGDSPEATPQE